MATKQKETTVTEVKATEPATEKNIPHLSGTKASTLTVTEVKAEEDRPIWTEIREWTNQNLAAQRMENAALWDAVNEVRNDHDELREGRARLSGRHHVQILAEGQGGGFTRGGWICCPNGRRLCLDHVAYYEKSGEGIALFGASGAELGQIFPPDHSGGTFPEAMLMGISEQALKEDRTGLVRGKWRDCVIKVLDRMLGVQTDD